MGCHKAPVVFEAGDIHFIFLTVLIISMTFVLSLTQMLVSLSVYVMLSIFFPFWSVRPQVCSVLVLSVFMSMHQSQE